MYFWKINKVLFSWQKKSVSQSLVVKSQFDGDTENSRVERQIHQCGLETKSLQLHLQGIISLRIWLREVLRKRKQHFKQGTAAKMCWGKVHLGNSGLYSLWSSWSSCKGELGNKEGKKTRKENVHSDYTQILDIPLLIVRF